MSHDSSEPFIIVASDHIQRERDTDARNTEAPHKKQNKISHSKWECAWLIQLFACILTNGQSNIILEDADKPQNRSKD